MDELRFRSQQSPMNDPTPMTTYASPPRNGALLPQPQASHDPRSSMPRRFTTDSSRVPTLSTVNSPQRTPGLDMPQDYTTLHKVQLIEQKNIEYERIREERRRFECEMQILDQQQRREAQELAQMEEEMGRLGGHQSEPTTPPEHQDNSGFPSIFSRPNRYSTSSLASPPGNHNRPARFGSQLASPPSGPVQHSYAFDESLPPRSVSTTRRNSDDEKEEAVRQDPTSHRSTNVLNRYSMPVTRTRNGLYDMNLDQTNTTRFLFGDEPKTSYRGQTPDNNFPTLVRREDQMLSASSAALDLALSPSPNPEPHGTNGWNRVNRRRPQQSMSSLNGSSPTIQAGEIPSAGSLTSSLRNSLDLKFLSANAAEMNSGILSAQNHHAIVATPPRLQSSYSTNDVPTMKNPSGPSILTANANSHAQQHFHLHNANIGRIPAGVAPNRGHNRELSHDNSVGNGREKANPYSSIQSALQANAPPFGPGLATSAPMSSVPTASSPTSTTPANHPFHGFYPSSGPVPVGPQAHSVGNYGMHMITKSMQQMGISGANGSAMFSPQTFTGIGSVSHCQGGKSHDIQARSIQHRRQLDNEAMSRYHNTPLKSFRGQIYDLCKDQHGCRYLQKKLEDRIPDQVNIIWLETNQNVMELMMDPFGNYLCQKLLEFCSDDERTVLIQNASQDMVRIALNQHGTRALQKMIEFVSTAQHVRLIIEALRFRVVELIKDLNGNHVIQKCLNKLTPIDAQFIFDAVGNNCVDVGTHRHGCCVLQRCMDHASGQQKTWLVERITAHARVLVQDPFGNYVVQYILDMNEPTFTDPLVQSFKGCIGSLSRHKFSSNVVEKCLRCGGPEAKDTIVDELLVPQEIERLLRDSYGNYVIQTALESATPHKMYNLVDAIRPLLPQIRNTPYGRRIQVKIIGYDNHGSAVSSGQVTPADNTQGQIYIRSSHVRAMSGNSSAVHNNKGLANSPSSGSRCQGVRQPGPTFPASGPVMMPSPLASGPAQQSRAQPGQFGQMAASAYPGAHRISHPTENGETHWL